MAKFFTSANDAFTKQEDRIYDKRKKNREDFLAYRKMKASMGEDVTAKELDGFRRSLAGGDAFFLRDLPSGAMMKELADRNNVLALNTRGAEEAKVMEDRKKADESWNSFLGYHSNVDVTDEKELVKLKKDWIAGFPDRPEMAESMWERRSQNIPEQHAQIRTQAVQDYLNGPLKNVNDVATAEKIMDANSVPSWKQTLIGIEIQRKQDELTATATADASKLVVGYSGEKLRHMSEDQIGSLASEIIAGSKYNLGKDSDEYKTLHASIVASLLTRQSQANSAKVELNEREFSTHILSKDSEFAKTVAAKGYDDADVLQAYNMARETYDLPIAANAQDPEFKKWIEAAERAIGTQYQTEWDAEQVKIDSKVEAALELAKKRVDTLAGMPEFAEGGAGFAVMTEVAANYVMTKDAFGVASELKARFGEDKLTSGTVDDAREMLNYLVATKLIQSSVAFQAEVRAEFTTNAIPPGSDLEVYYSNQEEAYDKEFAEAIETIFTTTLKFGDSQEQVIAKKQQIVEALVNQIDLDLRKTLQSKGAFRGLTESEITTKHNEVTNRVLEKVSQILADPKNSTGRPSVIRHPTLELFGSSNNTYKALNGSDQFKDTNGEPLAVGKFYKYDQKSGSLTPVSQSSVRQLPPMTPNPNRPQGFNPSTQMRMAFSGINNKTDMVYGFTPDPTIGIRPNGPFDTPADWLSSVVMQMAQAYRDQGTAISDRAFYELVGAPGASSYGLNASNFSDDPNK
jgi:hypothetical protein